MGKFSDKEATLRRMLHTCGMTGGPSLADVAAFKNEIEMQKAWCEREPTPSEVALIQAFRSISDQCPDLAASINRLVVGVAQKITAGAGTPTVS